MVMEAIVEYNYEAQEPDELTLRKGDVIKDIRVMPGGWWEGALRDKRGMFPDNFVKVVESAAGIEMSSAGKSEEVVLRNGNSNAGQVRRWCKVQFSYEPCNEDELALTPQDSLEFLGEAEEGWWRGRLRGRVGVFPSNFVTAPTCEEPEKEKHNRELCRVLFPYDALNEDELTLVEGEVLTILSKDAPDKGWWKGESRGRVGLFPDNFVEVLGLRNDSHESREQPLYSTNKSSLKHSTSKRTEKAHARRSLDTHGVSQLDGNRKSSPLGVSSSLSPLGSPSSSSASGPSTNSCSNTDKKPNGSQQLMTSLKRLVTSGSSTINSNTSNGSAANNSTGEVAESDNELDGVQRGEGAPLSHPTASRARLPRRRPPSSQHLRHRTATNPNASATTPTSQTDSGLANGNAAVPLERLREEEDEGEARTVKGRRMAPWVEELRLNQLERRKTTPVDKPEKVEMKKPRSIDNRGSTVLELSSKPEAENEVEIGRGKDPERIITPETGDQPPAFVPYSLYCQLLERVSALEAKQAMLQRTIGQLTDQILPLLANSSTSNKS